MSEAVSIVVDIGGTNTRVAQATGARVLDETILRYRNADYPALEPILDAYLAEKGVKARAICIDMAGPVTDGIGTLTNLDWTISSPALAARTGAARVVVINDMQAMGHALAHLGAESLMPLLPGVEGAAGPRMVFNVGTGLNAAPVHTAAHSGSVLTIVPPAEAGHVTLPTTTAEELRFADWLTARLGVVPGLEEALSGRGLEYIHAFLCHEDGEGTPLAAAAIMEAFLAGDARAVQAARIFVRYLARYAGDLALINLPFGGIYLVGGVAKHLGPHLLDLGLAEGFAAKGRFSDFMAQFPMYLVTDDYVALRGCAGHLAELEALG